MKINQNLRYLSLVVWLGATSALADGARATLVEPPHPIYHVVRDQTLAQAAASIANRGGFGFRIAAGLESDRLNRKLAAADWPAALAQLLEDYNYTLVGEPGAIRSVLISGRRHNGLVDPTSAGIAIEPRKVDGLPERYRRLKPGSAMPVELPMAQLRQLKAGDRALLDLPIGQYQVEHDRRTDHADGSSTWTGHLADEGLGYRLNLSVGAAGLMGNLYTPDGEYLIEGAGGAAVLVDLQHSGLTAGGFDGDHIEPSGLPAPTEMAKASLSTESLRTKAESLRADATALNQEATNLYGNYTDNQQLVANAQTALTAAKANTATAKAELASRKQTLKSAPKDATLQAAVASAKSALNAAKAAEKQANTNLKAVKKFEKSALSAYNKKIAAYKKANTKAEKAEADYAARLNETGGGNTENNGNNGNGGGNTTETNVVDVMVLYTTVGQSADYAKQRIQYLVDVSNQAYRDSGIHASLRLVHTEASAYTETNLDNTALDDLGAGNGAFANVEALRNRYGADVVVFFRPFYHLASGQMCGIAYQGFYNGGDAYPFLAYAVVGDGYSLESDNYYCTTGSFTHEIGHTLGNVHDREFSNLQGKFEYSYAWGIDNLFGTIMSYYSPQILLFSSPSLSTQCAGGPCGYPAGSIHSSDQTATTNYTAPFVSAYRQTQVSVPSIE